MTSKNLGSSSGDLATGPMSLRSSPCWVAEVERWAQKRFGIP